MMNSDGNRVLLLVGSLKAPGKSASEALGAYVIKKIEARGWSSQTIFIRASLQSDEGRAALLEAVKTADLIILLLPPLRGQPPSTRCSSHGIDCRVPLKY